MSRFCELKLIDVLREEPAMSKNRRKTTVVKTFPSESRSTKIKLGNFALSKRNNDSSHDFTSDSAEMRETRLTKKQNNSTKSNMSIQNVDIDSGSLSKVSEPKTEMRAVKPVKRKGYDNKVKNIEEPSIKKICSAGSRHSVSSNNPDKRVIRSRKRKKKSRESCWENKLTGAKRVSKRLSNLRMEKQKSLKNLGSSVDVSRILIESMQPITFSTRSQIKSNKELHQKPTNRRKAYYRNHQEVQFSFGKLSHTKRLYPKIAAGRRPATYTVTIKPTGSVQQNTRKRKKGNKHINYNKFVEDTSESDINSLIKKYVEDIQDEIVNEAGSKELCDSDITEDKETTKSNDQSKSKETTEESNSQDISQEHEVETLISGTVEEEFIDDSSFVIVDIESDENVECGTPEENTVNEQSSVFERNYDERKIEEKLSDLDDLSRVVPEDVTTIDLKQDNTNISEDIGLNTNVSETDLKSETTNNESTPTAVDSSAVSSVVETAVITNTAD